MARGRPKVIEQYVADAAFGRSEPDEGETFVEGITRDWLMENLDRWWDFRVGGAVARWKNIDTTKARRGIEEALLAKFRDGTIVRRYRFVMRTVLRDKNRPEMGTRDQLVREYEYFSRDALQYIPPSDSVNVGPIEIAGDAPTPLQDVVMPPDTLTERRAAPLSVEFP